MSYRIEFTDKARDSFARLPKGVQAGLARQIDSLADDPRPRGAKKIKGQDDCYRIRQGDYRIVYLVVDDRLFLLIVRAGHRRDVYKRMDTIYQIVERLRELR